MCAIMPLKKQDVHPCASTIWVTVRNYRLGTENCKKRAGLCANHARTWALQSCFSRPQSFIKPLLFPELVSKTLLSINTSDFLFFLATTLENEKNQVISTTWTGGGEFYPFSSRSNTDIKEKEVKCKGKIRSK